MSGHETPPGESLPKPLRFRQFLHMLGRLGFRSFSGGEKDRIIPFEDLFEKKVNPEQTPPEQRLMRLRDGALLSLESSVWKTNNDQTIRALGADSPSFTVFTLPKSNGVSHVFVSHTLDESGSIASQTLLIRTWIAANGEVLATGPVTYPSNEQFKVDQLGDTAVRVAAVAGTIVTSVTCLEVLPGTADSSVDTPEDRELRAAIQSFRAATVVQATRDLK